MNILSIKMNKLIASIAMIALAMTAAMVPYRAQAVVEIVTVAAVVDYNSCSFNVIWGCDEEGTFGNGGSVVPTVTLTAPETVNVPAPVELTWSTTDAVSCTASGGWSGSKGTSGTEKVIDPTGPNFAGSNTYFLSCVNDSGQEGSDSVTVNVIAPSVTLNATPPTVEIPDDVRLIWTSQNTVSPCVASGEWSGDKTLSGSEAVKTPTNTAFRGQHTYVMTCKNILDYAVSASVDVSVIQVPRCTFNANPSTIKPPQASNLEWACSYANACSINKGIGAVDPISGTRMVRPTETTDYVLTCQGLDGSREFSATVNMDGGSGRIIEDNP